MTEPTVPMPHPGWQQPEPEVDRTLALPVRRRRRGRRWLIALVVLVAIVIGLDRIALLAAEDQLAGRIQSSQHLSQKPSVSISGFPFLTQVAARYFGHATVDLHDLDANGLTISDLHADLSGVHVNGAFNGANVDTLTATARIDYTDIAAALASYMTVDGVQLGTATITPVGNGDLKASFSPPAAITQVLGGQNLLTLTIHIQLDGPKTLELRSGRVQSALADLGVDVNFDRKFDLSALPFSISLSSITTTPTAVEVAAVGHDVNLSRSGVSSSATGSGD